MISYPNVKLNLGLSVLRKREDGYHDLETLFIPYHGYSDILEITELPQNSAPAITIEGGDWDPLSDLSWKAYCLLRDEYGLPPVEIRLVKRSPVGAGLGGGSADAAFTLKMLNVMFGLGMDEARLASCAARLGSDCAFFIYNRPMLGEGKGEVLSHYDIDLSNYEIRVRIPEGISVSTKEAYSGIVPNPHGGIRDALAGPVSEWRRNLVNDFEKTVFKSHPEIEAVKERFYREGAVYSAMSGSGSAVFALFERNRV